MDTWAGTDRMSDGQRPAGRGGRLAGVRTYHREPAPNSVHLVDAQSGMVVCGTVEAATLTRLERPWSEWMGIFRCGRCHEIHPMG